MNFARRLRLDLEMAWTGVFQQDRTLQRAVDHAMMLAGLDHERTIAHTISASGRDQDDWSAEYKMFSRSNWAAEELLDEPLRYCIECTPEGPIVIAGDDTKLKKSGTHIPGVSYQRDPMSPAFHTNLIRASRYLQAAAVVHCSAETGARTLPVCFREAPVLKKPGKRASDEQIAAWKQARKTHNLSACALTMIKDLRQRADRLGALGRTLLMALDGSFCNRTIFSQCIEGVDIVARCRKDAKLARPSSQPNKVYDPVKFTPEQVRKDDSIAWTKIPVHYGGQWREVRCKQVNRVLWQGGSKRRLIRLFVIAAQPYRTSPGSRVNYRQEAYGLTTDLDSPLELLVQAMFDRWQIEVNHREEKTGFGVGEAQVRSPQSVPRHPAFAVALYSIMHLCALKLFGPARTDDYLPLPKWRRKAKRPSIMDLKRLLQHEGPNKGSDQPSHARWKQKAAKISAFG